MSTSKTRFRPEAEECEPRLALNGGYHALPSPHHRTAPASPSAIHATATADATGQDTLSVLQAFAKANQTITPDALYNPAVDANHNGQIGMVDGRILIHELPPLSPDKPLKVAFLLAPGEEAKGPTPQDSGGKTYLKNVTILGSTTPGALIFTDGPLNDYSFSGKAIVANAQGAFADKVTLSAGLNNNDFLIIDHYGHQIVADYPIMWLKFAALNRR